MGGERGRGRADINRWLHGRGQLATREKQGAAHQGSSDHGNGRDQREAVHGRPPWTQEAQAADLRRHLDGPEDGGHDTVRGLIGHQVEPGSKQSIGVADRARAIRPSGMTGARSASMAERNSRVA